MKMIDNVEHEDLKSASVEKCNEILLLLLERCSVEKSNESCCFWLKQRVSLLLARATET